MTSTPRLRLPYLHSNQAQKEITHNESLTMLDALIQPVVQTITLEALPQNAQSGQLYVIAATAQGDLAMHANNLAQKLDTDWRFIKPLKWMEVTLDSNGARYRFDGTKWGVAETTQVSTGLQLQNQHQTQSSMQSPQLPQAPQGANNVLINKDTGEYLKIQHLEEEIQLSGAYTDTTIKIPHHSIVIAVNIRVTEAITGASSFSVGINGNPNRYGGNLGASKDTTNVGLTESPLTCWYDTAIRITAGNGSFTGGKIHVTIHTLKPHGPWNWE